VRFYEIIESQNLTQVEDNLFKVPKQYFQKNSRIFSNIFGDDYTAAAEGSSDEKPIHLYSIQKVDFERLLAVMHQMSVVNFYGADICEGTKL